MNKSMSEIEERFKNISSLLNLLKAIGSDGDRIKRTEAALTALKAIPAYARAEDLADLAAELGSLEEQLTEIAQLREQIIIGKAIFLTSKGLGRQVTEDERAMVVKAVTDHIETKGDRPQRVLN